jgi:hypothetical protein
MVVAKLASLTAHFGKATALTAMAPSNEARHGDVKAAVVLSDSTEDVQDAVESSAPFSAVLNSIFNVRMCVCNPASCRGRTQAS